MLSQISCLCLFDLSAAFDTIDHNILLSRLPSWFWITGTVLDWFKSYTSSRPFRVKCESSFSSLHICFVASRKYLFSAHRFYHVHHPSHFINLFLKITILYADDAQLFFSFHPSDVHSSITSPWRYAAILNGLLIPIKLNFPHWTPSPTVNC